LSNAKRWNSVFGWIRRHVADDHLAQPQPQLGYVFRTIQLLELSLGFTPKRGRLVVKTATRIGEFDQAASAISG
jgi:hypothetical protein